MTVRSLQTTTLPRRPAIPAPLTSFVGRKQELGSIDEAIRNSRLATLWGPGGAGKTRLAVEFARRAARRFEGGVAFVELAHTADPTDVPHAVAAALGVPERAMRSADAAIDEHLAEFDCLLVLDNCEHVVDAVAAMVARLLAGHDELRVLATSRERLDIPGEQTVEVRPMGTARWQSARDLAALESSDAAALFCERARQHVPGFRLDEETAPSVAAICSRLDGIPLAIELGAARLRTMGVSELAATLGDPDSMLATRTRLRGLEPRQQTLADLVDWSYRLLGPQEQAVYRRLSVFAGTFTAEAASVVASDEALPPAEVSDVVALLADKAVLLIERTAGTTRFRMLETVREHASRLLEDGEVPKLTDRLLHWASQVAHEVEAAGDTDEVLAAERATLLDAIRRGAEADPGTALEVAVALGDLWLSGGRLQDARSVVATALEAAGPGGAIGARGIVLLGSIAQSQGDFQAAVGFYNDVLGRGAVDAPEQNALPDKVVVQASSNLGTALSQLGDLDGARVALAAALDRARRSGLHAEVATALHGLGALAWRTGDLVEAGRLFEDSLVISRSAGTQTDVGRTLNALAIVAAAADQVDAARSRYEESLQIARRTQNRRLELSVLVNLGALESDLGNLPVADQLYEQGLSIAEEVGTRAEIAICLQNLGVAAERRGALRRARSLTEESLAMHRELGTKRGIADTHLNLARIAGAQGRRQEARRLYGAARGAYAELGDPPVSATAAFELGVLLREEDPPAAIAALQEAADLSGASGEPDLAELSAELASCIRDGGRPADALAPIDRYAEASRAGGFVHSLLLALRMRTQIGASGGDVGAEQHAECVREHAAFGHGPGTAYGLAALASMTTDVQLVAQLAGAVEVLLDASGAALPHALREALDVAARRASSTMGPEAWTAQALAGRSVDPLDLLGAALGENLPSREPAVAVSADVACTMSRTGDVWSIAFEGAEASFKDAKGLRYLATLLQSPGIEVHALELAVTPSGARPSTGGDDELHTGGGGEVLIDAAAKRAYRSALSDLESELQEAEAFNDDARAERIRAEMDAILAHLSAGLGLGGRSRTSATDAERARQAVSKAIRQARRKIADQLPELGAYLESFVATGTFCSYTPDPRHPIEFTITA